MGKAENEARKLKEFRNKLTTREDVQEILQLYDDRRIKSLEARLWWLEKPLWYRAWLTVARWAVKDAQPWLEAHLFRPVRRAWWSVWGSVRGWW